MRIIRIVKGNESPGRQPRQTSGGSSMDVFEENLFPMPTDPPKA